MRMAKQWRTVVHWSRRLLQGAEQAVLPCSCAFCGCVLAAGSRAVCDACHAELPWLSAVCRRCGLPLAGDLSADTECGRCQLYPPPYAAVVAPLRYEFPVDALIKALKFQRKLHYVPALASLLRDSLHRLPPGIDAVLPVPLHWRRQMWRGFNQAEELCRALDGELCAPLLDQVRRRHSTPAQSGLGAAARRANLRGAFELSGDLAAGHVLVVDDVVTTGATCEQLAAMLLRAGVREVSVLAIARATGACQQGVAKC